MPDVYATSAEAEPIEPEPVDRIRVMILMDNATDLPIPDQGPVTRLSAPKALAHFAPRVPAPVRDALTEALRPLRTSTGGVRMEDELRYVIAVA